MVRVDPGSHWTNCISVFGSKYRHSGGYFCTGK